MRYALAIALGLSLAAPALHGQTVRGTLKEQGSAEPVPGAVVSLHRAEDAGGPPVASVLTDEQGAFALRAPAPGSWVLRAKRIGVRQVSTAPFALATGETRAEALEVTPLPAVQPEIRVTGRTQCNVRGEGNPFATALWEDASAALAAVSLTRAGGGFTGTVTKFSRDVEPGTGKVRTGATQVRTGYAERPFRSAPPDFLARNGYVQVDADGVAYYAPDTETLLSEPFLRDHCFSLEMGDGENLGLVGLAFRPVRRPRNPDVTGELWIHPRSRELRRIEVRYTHLPNGKPVGPAGATLHLSRLPSGAWIVSHWVIRMPVWAELRGPGIGGGIETRDTLLYVREEGGEVVRQP